MSIAGKSFMEIERSLKEIRENLELIWFLIDREGDKVVDDTIDIVDSLLR